SLALTPRCAPSKASQNRYPASDETRGYPHSARNLAIAPGRNRQAPPRATSPVIIRTVSCSALAPARLIAIASSTPGKSHGATRERGGCRQRLLFFEFDE